MGRSLWEAPSVGRTRAVRADALDPVELFVAAGVETVGDLLGLGPGRVPAHAVAIAVVVLSYDEPGKSDRAVVHCAPPLLPDLRRAPPDKETAIRICPSLRPTFTQRTRVFTKRYATSQDGLLRRGRAPVNTPPVEGAASG